MAIDQKFNSRYTGEEMENAFSVALAIANHSGIPKGTGKGSVQIISMDTDRLTSDGERIPTSAVVAQAIASARKVSELLTFKGIVQTTDDLPADAKPGFVYIVVQKDNENYVWDGASWTPIGKLIAPIVLSSQSVSYQISDSGDTVPSGEWLAECPEVQHGKYLWTRTVVQFSVGDPITSYSCAYIGVDGREITVCGVKAGESGNVALTAKDVSAVPTAGGEMTGNLSVPAPSENAHAVNKVYVDTTAVTAALPVSSWVGSGPYTQTVTVAALTDGRRCMVHPAYGDDTAANIAMREACACLSYTKRDGKNITFTCLEDKPAVDIAVIVEVYV